MSSARHPPSHFTRSRVSRHEIIGVAFIKPLGTYFGFELRSKDDCLLLGLHVVWFVLVWSGLVWFSVPLVIVSAESS